MVNGAGDPRRSSRYRMRLSVFRATSSPMNWMTWTTIQMSTTHTQITSALLRW